MRYTLFVEQGGNDVRRPQIARVGSDDASPFDLVCRVEVNATQKQRIAFPATRQSAPRVFGLFFSHEGACRVSPADPRSCTGDFPNRKVQESILSPGKERKPPVTRRYLLPVKTMRGSPSYS